MPERESAAVRFGVILLLLVGRALALDISRPRCERSLSRVLPWVVAVVSEDAAEAIFRRLTTVVSDAPVLVIKTTSSEVFQIPGGSVEELWNNAQAGVFSAIPPLDAVLIARPYWYSDAEEFFADTLSANAGLERWGAGALDGATLLLLQLGGGVEDLQLQILLEENGIATVWLLDSAGDDDWLPEPVVLAIEPEVAGRAFDLARKAGLPEASESRWTCGALDGAVNSFVMAESEKVGRLSYLNSLRPAEELVLMRKELLQALGIVAGGPGYEWQDGSPDHSSRNAF